MKKIKGIVLLIFLLFLCSGCSSNYTLIFEEDGKVREVIGGFGDLSDVQVELYDMTETFYKKEMPNYIFTDVENEGSDEKFVYQEYDDFESYIKNSYILKETLGTDFIRYTNKEITIDRKINLLEFDKERVLYLPTHFTIEIRLPFKAKINNADKYDKETNSYTWNVSEGKETSIKLKIDRKKFSNYKASDQEGFIILGCIVGGIILFGGIIALYIFIRGRRQNKL